MTHQEREREKKAQFVVCELSELLRAIDDDCTGAIYKAVGDDERVTVWFTDNSKRTVDVTADSLLALTRDVLRVMN